MTIKIVGGDTINVVRQDNKVVVEGQDKVIIQSLGVQGLKGDTGGLHYRGTWNVLSDYLVNDIVYWQGISYICVVNSTGDEPPDSVHWNPLFVELDPLSLHLDGLNWTADTPLSFNTTSKHLTVDLSAYSTKAQADLLYMSIGYTPPYPTAGITVSTGSGWGTSLVDNHVYWDAGYTYRLTSFGTTSPLSGSLSNNALTINIQKSDASHDGYLTLGDWNVFNNKQPAGSYLTDAPSDGSTYGRKNGAWSNVGSINPWTDDSINNYLYPSNIGRYVGIATQTPHTPFEVNGIAYFGADLANHLNYGTVMGQTNWGTPSYTPASTLDLRGKLTLADDSFSATDGMLRYASSKFQFHQGGIWNDFVTSLGSAGGWTDDGVTYVTLTSSGRKVIIGSSATTTYKLHVDGTGYFSSDVKTDGSVGIHITPVFRLDVNGKIRISDDSITAQAGNIRYSSGQFQGYDGASWNTFITSVGSAGGWTDDGADYVTLTTSTRFVGIGVGTPLQKLHVSGNAYITGALGLGVNPATQKLEVNGKIRVGNDGTAANAGAIRWDGSHFSGYNGSSWLDLDIQSFATAGGWTDDGVTYVYLTDSGRSIRVGGSGTSKFNVEGTSYLNGNTGIRLTPTTRSLVIGGYVDSTHIGGITLIPAALAASPTAGDIFVDVNDGNILKWYNGSTWQSAVGAGTLAFINLSDTPNSYSGQGLKSVRVNSGATGLEFFTPASGMVYPGAGIALSTGSAWGTSITDNSGNWNTAYGWGNHASAGYFVGTNSTIRALFSAGTGISYDNSTGIITNSAPAGTWGALNYPTWTSGTPFVKMTAAGTFALDTNTYLTSVTAHNLLSATHGDTLTDSVVSGDIIIGNATPKWARLAKGTDTQVLTLVSGLPSWQTPAAGGMTDPMTTRGDIIYRNASNVTSRLPAGTNTQVLTSNGTDISWQTPASGFSDPMTTRGDIIIRNASNVTARLGIGTNTQVLTSNGTDIAWSSLPASAVTSVSNSDGTLTISPTTGAVVASLALGHANSWTGQQTFGTSAPIFSTMTAGSVLYAGTSGLLSQDNANFFWDATNHRLGIGTTTPSTRLELVPDASGYVERFSHPSLAHGMTSVAPTNVFAAMEAYGTGVNGGYIFRGLNDSTQGANPALFFVGINGAAAVTAPPIVFRAGKKSGTGYGLLADSESAIGFDNYLTRLMTILGNGNVGIGQTSPTALIHLKAGTATASTAPLKFTSGTLMTNPEVGAQEFLTDKFYGTITTGTARKEYALWDAAGTSGRVPYETTNGRLTDSGNLTYDATTLAITGKMTITNGTTTNVNLILKQVASQSADLLKIQDSSAADVARVDVNGTGYFGGTGQSSLTKGLIISSGAGAASTDLLNLNMTGTVVNGSTSGTANFRQTDGGTAYKRVVIYCAALTGTASFTYITAFVNTPMITSATLSAVPTTISNTAVTLTGAASTGFIILEGF